MASYTINDDLFEDDPEEASPSELNTKNCGQFIEVSKDKLSVKYIGTGTHTNDVGAIQANRPAPTQRLLYYFEVAVRDRGEKGRISVGFTEKSFKMSRQPGWEPNSYGYHGDDGKFYNANGQGDVYGPFFTTNDMIGAGINYSTQELFFTKNGKLLGVACKDVKGQLFPTIGLHSLNERVLVCQSPGSSQTPPAIKIVQRIEANFGKRTFLFDIEAMVKEERNKRLKQVEGIPLSSSISHSIVRDYFSFYGYQATLAAFESTTAKGDLPQSQSVENPMVGTSSTQHSGGYRGLENRKTLRQMPVCAYVRAMAYIKPDGFMNDLHQKKATILIRSGDIDTAISKVQEWYPGIIQSNMSGISFLLTSQKFIELIRRGDLNTAVDYGRRMLSGVQTQGLNESQETHRQNCLALLAYEDPLLSPVSYLLGANQREAVADTVNAAILTSQDEPHQSVLERLLRQLTACNGEKRAIEGGQGEVFRLQKILNESLVGSQ